MVYTINEKMVIRVLSTAIKRDYSINSLAKECGLSPNGAYKILKNFEKEGVLIKKETANIISYKLNFGNEMTLNILEIALQSTIEGRIKNRYFDFLKLKDVAKACIVFGSYVEAKETPDDIDILVILEKDNYSNYKKILQETALITPIKIHDMVQTKEDLTKNLINEDKVVVNIIKKGVILWGYNTLAEVIKNANKTR